jgi:hypothetical protein
MGERGGALTEYRCRNADCRALLFRAQPTATGRIEIVCPNRRCRRGQTIVLPDETRAERCATVPHEREQERQAS